MGRGKLLNEAEIKVITQLKKENISNVKIAKILRRSRNVINNYVKDPENYGCKKIPGRPHAVTKREKRAILKTASNSLLTARQVAAEAGVSTNVRNVQRIIKNSDNIQRTKLKRKPPLTKKHIEDRLQFVREHCRWKKRWRRVIFTDEKRFTLDGPDGWSYYFHVLRKDELFNQRRQMAGGGIMVWAEISYNGRTRIRFVTTKLNSQGYIELLREEIHDQNGTFSGRDIILQQDNAAVHCARRVKEFLEQENINLLPWPARSPDLNLIENAWGHLARIVYSQNRQFQSIQEIKIAIEQSWAMIPRKYIKRLFKSLPQRMLEVIDKRGKCTHY